MSAPQLSYVLPLRWTDDGGRLPELTGYLEWLARRAQVVVVDGSPPELFQRHADAWYGHVRHLPPDPGTRFANGKVDGVTTGVLAARTERVVIADDDVRYDDAGLTAVAAGLAEADLVRPQNHFDPLPWHALWDSGRILLNRALGHDYPGTFGVRRSTFLAMGGYDGDVMFENLELVRTVLAHGGAESRRRDLYVRRLPPDTAHFCSQRLRQAYDDTAQPLRLAGALAVLPAAVTAAARGRADLLALGALAAVAVAEAGRRRAGGARYFPFRCSLFAPLWLAERGLLGWVALARHLGGAGVRYRGRRLRLAAHPLGWLARHPRPPLVPRPVGTAAGGEADRLVASVAEGLHG
ncbi:glycosyltransferase [Allonocardiopsis opalescens]|uniref:Glycosyl transferase family 21 n=1 Tax=Allonocardiopsis opalescens TaxID=1144618 RepID=A0A2T0Q1Z5_9ACTN|nr:hypothetical protein [Allonocardiopsis opalescens]PRX97799.1 hypothetical protein CLV72_105149 [Allonocardiopsis opalescens]